jgi:hypothetical protein
MTIVPVLLFMMSTVLLANRTFYYLYALGKAPEYDGVRIVSPKAGEAAKQANTLIFSLEVRQSTDYIVNYRLIDMHSTI